MNKAVIAWGVFAIVVIALLLWAFTHRLSVAPQGDTASSTPTTVADPSTLLGIAQTKLAPGVTWPPEITNLPARLAVDGMAPQTMEGEVLHIHQHLDLFIHGQQISVPALIGINEQANWLSTIHVHDNTGIIHVESPFKANFTLGEFFDIWGVYFTKDCLGGYCADATNSLKVYVNGRLYQGDPRLLVLASHQEIAIVFGSATETPATVPVSYAFPAGY